MQPLQHNRDNQGGVGAHMTPPAEPDPPADAADEQLADLLEECLRAERAVPGSSAAIVQTAPEQLRPDLEQLLALGQALRVSSPAKGEASSLSDARARIMTRIEPTAPS
jgi:hypothetical protein